MRIALLSYRGNPYCGGQGVYVYYLSRELLRLGHEVTVFAGPPYPRVPEGVRLVRVPSLELYAGDGLARLHAVAQAAGRAPLAPLLE